MLLRTLQKIVNIVIILLNIYIFRENTIIDHGKIYTGDNLG